MTAIFLLKKESTLLLLMYGICIKVADNEEDEHVIKIIITLIGI